jgi:predicted AAA+ superfamily ATPase
MKRNMMDVLLAWKKNPRRRPLVLRGTRQTGKSWLLREFGARYYPRQAYFHLGTDGPLRSFLDREPDPAGFLEFLEVYGKVPIRNRDTLVILDDLQECPAARQMLGALAMEFPDLSLAAAERTPAPFPLPVLSPADAQTETLYPLDFEEFLWACREVSLAKEIREHYSARTPMEKEVHTRALHLFQTYLAVGGFPAAVLAYRETHSLLGVPDLLDKLRLMDLEDISRCQEKEIRSVTRACYRSLPAQLLKENAVFQCCTVQKGSTYPQLEPGIRWLEEQGLAIRVAQSGAEPRHFKLYPRDPGLCAAGMGELGVDLLRMERTLPVRRLTEACLAAAFAAKGYAPACWASGNKAILPFLIKRGEMEMAVDLHFDPGKKSRSLFEYQKEHPEKALQISAQPLEDTPRFYNLPYYAVFCI